MMMMVFGKTMLVMLVPFVAAAADVESLESNEPSIHVKSVVEIEGKKDSITLGDLIVAHGLKASAVNSLLGVRLADAPHPGESRSFSDVGLTETIRAQLRLIAQNDSDPESAALVGRVEVRVPSRVTVIRKIFKLTPSGVETELRAQWQKQKLCDDCQVEILGLSIPLIDVKANADASWKLRVGTEMPKGSFSVPLDVTNSKGRTQTFWVTGTAVVKRRVPVASRALMMGEKISLQDFTIQTKDVTFSHDVAASEADITSSVVGRSLSAGQIITRSALRRELAVKHGDTVKLVAGNDDWQISIDGVVQASGYIGDLIRVKIPRTQKVVTGMLKDNRIVEVR